jgi:hypothetical protein
MTPDIDASARLLTWRIQKQLPTAFFRFGDGPLECIYCRDRKSHTCDGERYTAELAEELVFLARELLDCPDVFIGDWGREIETTAYAEQWLTFISGLKANLLHYEALLMVRESPALVDFYRAVKQSPQRKLFLGRPSNADAARMMDAAFFAYPEHYDDLDEVLAIGDVISVYKEFDLLLFGAGMAGNVVAGNLWREHPARSYISVGSAMDPLFSGVSRSNQLPPQRARALFQELL